MRKKKSKLIIFDQISSKFQFLFFYRKFSKNFVLGLGTDTAIKAAQQDVDTGAVLYSFFNIQMFVREFQSSKSERVVRARFWRFEIPGQKYQTRKFLFDFHAVWSFL